MLDTTTLQAPPNALDTDVSQTPSSTSAPTQSVVLVAEDDPVFRHLLKFTIERAGYEVIAVPDGEDAWQRLQLGGIDLLVTDHQMPRCSGLELLDRLTSSGLCPPTVLCTAKGLELDRRVMQEKHGLLAVMGKPFSPKQLAHCIDEYFREQ